MPRKAAQTVTDTPPGPIAFELRINDKIALLQRVHSYKIDQQSDEVVITGVLRKAADDV
jgi:hypothetical protein